jgi:tryptophanyl-tRNA synthetase
MSKKPVLLSGIKPTGDVHLGNYFGAIREQVALLNSGEYQCFIMVADYHALNFIQDAEEMRRRTRELTATYVAAGLDPKKVTLFKQSEVSAHAELAWIFDTITTMPYLERAHAYKDAGAKNKEISVGTFNYPMLMAADILLYDAAVVPVGQDQKQHIEYARDTAEKFNRLFGETFLLPKEHVVPEVAIVPGIDGRKMSKSYGNVIPLFGSKEDVRKRVMAIVTDSSGGHPEHVYAIHRLLKSEEELAPLYEANQGKYQALKTALADDLEAFIAPMRTKYEELMRNPAKLDRILEAGGRYARKQATSKILFAKKRIGVS